MISNDICYNKAISFKFYKYYNLPTLALPIISMSLLKLIF